MKDIPGYEKIYAITEDGQVWSYRRQKFLAPDITRLGYVRYRLCKDNKVERFLAHRLVAQAFIPNPDNLPEVGHLDESRDNNNVSNLYWTSHFANCNMPLRRQRLSESLCEYWSGCI